MLPQRKATTRTPQLSSNIAESLPKESTSNKEKELSKSNVKVLFQKNTRDKKKESIASQTAKESKSASLEIVKVSDRQIIENVLQSSKCLWCCDLQIGLTICFVWVLMCSMPAAESYRLEKWYLSLISFIQMFCMVIGIIAVWRAERTGLIVTKYAIYVNIILMVIGGVLFIILTFTKSSFVRVGNFVPVFMRLQRKDIVEDKRLLIIWSVLIIFTIILQVWIIVSINRAIKAIERIKNNDDESYVL